MHQFAIMIAVSFGFGDRIEVRWQGAVLRYACASLDYLLSQLIVKPGELLLVTVFPHKLPFAENVPLHCHKQLGFARARG